MLKRFLVDGDSVSSSQHSFVTLAANPEIFENVKKVILDSISNKNDNSHKSETKKSNDQTNIDKYSGKYQRIL